MKSIHIHTFIDRIKTYALHDEHTINNIKLRFFPAMHSVVDYYGLPAYVDVPGQTTTWLSMYMDKSLQHHIFEFYALDNNVQRINYCSNLIKKESLWTSNI